jgi:UDP-N-acetylglucosamine--N-acetylmuramyl-(pentapeptide) pyrophosphoryl-undecaprenol N-acetylglucosamine transferase
MKNMYVSFVGGKSGGHVLPCIAKAQEIIAHNPTTKIVFFTSRSSLDKKIIENYTCIEQTVFLPMQAMVLKKWWRIPQYAIQFLHSFFISMVVLHRYKPQMLISMGGIISIPVCLAAKLLGIPIMLQELNVIPGKAIKALAPLATEISVCFEKTRAYFAPRACIKRAYPLRFKPSLAQVTKEQACAHLGLCDDIPILMIIGGSQGSVFLNALIKRWLAAKPSGMPLQVIHQLGDSTLNEWQALYATHGIPALVFSFNHAIEYCYAASDLVLCRAGAGTLFELLFFQKKCITIPLETTENNHQLFNAQAFAHEYPHMIRMFRQQELHDITSFSQHLITDLRQANQ